MDRLLGRPGYVDAFREVRPDRSCTPGGRTAAGARQHVGWRIDYQVVKCTLAGKARSRLI